MADSILVSMHPHSTASILVCLQFNLPLLSLKETTRPLKHNLLSGGQHFFGYQGFDKTIPLCFGMRVRSSHLLFFRARCSQQVQWWKDHRHWSHLQWIHEDGSFPGDPTKNIDFSPFLKGKAAFLGIFPKKRESFFQTLKMRTQRIFWYPKSSRIIPLDVWWFYGLTCSDSSQAEGLPQSCLCIWWTCDNKHPPFSVVLCRNHYWGTTGSNVRHS